MLGIGGCPRVNRPTGGPDWAARRAVARRRATAGRTRGRPRSGSASPRRRACLAVCTTGTGGAGRSLPPDYTWIHRLQGRRRVERGARQLKGSRNCDTSPQAADRRQMDGSLGTKYTRLSALVSSIWWRSRNLAPEAALRRSPGSALPSAAQGRSHSQGPFQVRRFEVKRVRRATTSRAGSRGRAPARVSGPCRVRGGRS